MRAFPTVLTVLAAAFMHAQPASASERAEVGRLDCDVSAGIGVIVGSQQDVSCVFKSSARGPSTSYVGRITQFGIDVGEIKAAKLAWLVFAPSDRSENALSGTYGGVSADAAIGLGLGAKVLVGGEHGTISLQPLALEAEQGFNVAAGITSMTVRAAD